MAAERLLASVTFSTLLVASSLGCVADRPQDEVPEASGRPAAERVEEDVRTHADGTRTLTHAVVISAPRTEVWRAFTTSDGVMSWAVPFAYIDFRLGGLWESSYDPAATRGQAGNIQSRFIAYVPERMLAMQAVAAPPGFPHPELLSDLFSVVEFEDAEEGHTRVTMHGVGYKEGAGYDAVLNLFRQGNAWSLGMLATRFEEGPVDWSRALAPGSGGGR